MSRVFGDRYWRGGGLLCAGLLGLLVVAGGCERRSRSTNARPSTERGGPAPTHVSWDARFEMSEDGRPRAVLRAPRMEQYRVGDSTYSVWRTKSDTLRVRAYLFDAQGDSSATLVADSLLFQEQKGVMDAYRDVVVTTEDKRLESEHLTWQQADRKIRTRRFVRIRTPSEVVQGNGLVADEDLETYQLGRFQAEVELEDDGAGEDSTRAEGPSP